MPRQPQTFRPAKATAPTHRPKEADRQARRTLHTGTVAWRRLREAVLVRDAHRCRACGRIVVGRNAHVDHIDGNDANNDLTNLQTLCQRGHSRKTFAEERGQQWDGVCEPVRAGEVG